MGVLKMSNIRFINPKSKAYHNVLLSSSKYLLIVTCSCIGQALMTQEAFECLMPYLDDADRQSVQVLEIAPDSAARLGYARVWTKSDVIDLFGPKLPIA